MSAKQAAIKDIKNDLKEYGKCFIAFHHELDEAINGIVKDYLKQQEMLCQRK